ncbi:transcriptional regulator, PadR family [Streptococcus gallolyticus subsp. gallolyticus TX20005]|nr:transcriptional regulator, PadR family [Streptococcus gallolyticus subsp. gallolyticus TX20005]
MLDLLLIFLYSICKIIIYKIFTYQKGVFMYFPTSATVIEFLILAIVDKDDSYGYAISQTIKQIANIKESTLYPILKKLEKAGYLTTYQQAYQGRKRKYYAITAAGKEQLTFLKKEWQRYKEKVDEIIEGRLEDDKS